MVHHIISFVVCCISFFFFFKQKTAYDMRISDWSSDVCSSDLKAIVGANAFAHESGIHQDGMLKHAGTYEIMTPESVGLNRSTLVMGKHSGRHAFRKKLEELGFNLAENQQNGRASGRDRACQ